MERLNNVRVAVIAMDGFEEAELTEPLQALKQAGATVDVVSKNRGRIQGFKHHDKAGTIPVDRTLDEANAADYDAIVLPGGALNADVARMEPKLREILKSFMADGKPVAAICHAPWELISSGVVRGRKLTSYYTIQDDVRNAGGEWVDSECVVDDNLVTSRQPSDLPAFNREMISLFACVPAGTCLQGGGNHV